MESLEEARERGNQSFRAITANETDARLDHPHKWLCPDPYVFYDTSFAWGHPKPPNSTQQPISATHSRVISNNLLTVFESTGPLSDLYSLWSPYAAVSLLNALGFSTDPKLGFCGWSWKELSKHVRKVWVFRPQAGLLGRYLHQLTGDRKAYKFGFVIQLLGEE